MASEETKRIGRSSLIAWIAMVGLMVVTAGVKWNQPGFRDPGLSSPFTVAAVFALFMALPLFALASVLALLLSLADRWLHGRLTLAGNALIGALLGALNAVVFLAAGTLIGETPVLTSGTLATCLPILAVGGIVASLGMRRR